MLGLIYSIIMVLPLRPRIKMIATVVVLALCLTYLCCLLFGVPTFRALHH